MTIQRVNTAKFVVFSDDTEASILAEVELVVEAYKDSEGKEVPPDANYTDWLSVLRSAKLNFGTKTASSDIPRIIRTFNPAGLPHAYLVTNSTLYTECWLPIDNRLQEAYDAYQRLTVGHYKYVELPKDEAAKSESEEGKTAPSSVPAPASKLLAAIEAAKAAKAEADKKAEAAKVEAVPQEGQPAKTKKAVK